MLGSFLIFLREGIEGTLICAILLTYLAAGGRRDLFRWVFGGAAAAVVLSLISGVVIYIAVKAAFVDSTAQLWFETCTFALAVVVLTYMTFWMKRHARNMAKNLRTRTDGAVAGGSGMALALVAMATVGREAVETTIFLLAIAFQSSPLNLAIGAALGLAVSLSVSFAMYKVGLKLNMARFFTAVGAALMVVAAGLVANLVQNLQELGVLPGAGHSVWDTSHVVPQDGALGDILHGLLGYAASPTALQVAVYAAFLAVGLYAFLRRPRALTTSS